MGIVIAFRTRLISPDDAVTATAPAIAEGEGEKCGELIVFPGTDFSSILPALCAVYGAAKPPRKTDYPTVP